MLYKTQLQLSFTLKSNVMKRKFFRINLKLVLLFLMGIWLSSCKTVYYPTTHNSPMLNNKGEFQASGIIGTGNFELQTAYAITDNIGVMLNGSYFNGTREIEINNEKTEIKEMHNLIEAGAGYFTNFGKLGKLEVFAGGGVGKVPANFRGIDYYDGTQTSDMTKLFIQPSIGLGSDFVDFSGGVRISAVNVSRAMRLFAEPELTIKLGYKHVRLVASIGLALPMNNINNSRNDELLSWDYNPVIIGLGIQLNLGRKYEKH